MTSEDRYLHIAPDFDRTVMQDDFGSKIGATTKGEDISTMERVHRWVAGSRMAVEHPMTGVGPANFYKSYRPYTIFSFETYVSDNVERSGIHNYYLMLLVEQGIIGLLLFLVLLILVFGKLEQRYHSAVDEDQRRWIVMLGSVLIMIVTINAINDMIEVIKIGGLFYFALSLLHLVDRSNLDKEKIIIHPS